MIAVAGVALEGQSRAAGCMQESEREEVPREGRETCVVFGKLVDARGEPIVGAHVDVGSRFSFTTGKEYGPSPPYSWWGAYSGEEGTFRFEMLVPEEGSVRLVVRPDVYHRKIVEWMSSGSSTSRAWLVDGQFDLGTIELGDAGLVKGRVLDEAGEPLAGVGVWVSVATPDGVVYLFESTDEQGRFESGHLPEGVATFAVRPSGFLMQESSDVRVRNGETAADLEFVLRTAPLLRGRVVDDEGRALVGVELSASPVRWKERVTGVSGAEGEFALPVRVDAPHSISAKLEGYESVSDEGIVYHELEEPCEVVLRRKVHTRFVVLDDETGEPVEAFRLQVLRRKGAAASARRSRGCELIFPPWTSRNTQLSAPWYTGGEALVACEPGQDRFGLLAPDYLPLEGEVAHESADSNRQVVRLKRGAGLEGTVVYAGRPVAGATLHIQSVRGSSSAGAENTPASIVYKFGSERGLIVEGSGVALRPGGPPRRRPKFRADEKTWIERETKADGSFRVRGLPAGTYRIAVRDEQGASTVVVPVQVDEGRNVQLGQVVLSDPGTITGRVITPPGVSPQGIIITARGAIDGERGLTAVRTGPRGEFRFEDVCDGDYDLKVNAIEGLLREVESVLVSVRNGASPDITLDLSECGLCHLKLELHFAAAGQESLQAQLVSAGDGRGSAVLTSLRSGVETVDDFFPAYGQAYVEIRTRSRIVFRQPAEGLVLTQQGSVQRTLYFPTGALELKLPPELELPDCSAWTVRLHPTTTSADTPYQEVQLGYGMGRRGEVVGMRFDLEARSVHIALVPAGSYRAVLELADPTAKWGQLGSDEQGEPIWGRKPAFRGECLVTIPDGGVGKASVSEN